MFNIKQKAKVKSLEFLELPGKFRDGRFAMALMPIWPVYLLGTLRGEKCQADGGKKVGI